MRERDAADPASSADLRDGRIVDVTDAVPHHVPVRGPHEKGTLSDAERWRHAHADESGLELAELDPVFHQTKLLDGRPSLTALPHVLPLVLADGAVLRWRLARRLLDRAGYADVRPHSAAVGSARSFSLSGGSFRL